MLSNNRNPWSEQDDMFLKEAWGAISINLIMHHLKRSRVAIQRRASLLGLGAQTDQSTFITLSEFCSAFDGVHKPETIKSWAREHGFPLKYLTITSRRVAMVDIDAFWIWAENNKKLVNFAKLERNTLGPEPAWIVQARSAAFLRNTRSPRRWTNDDDNKLMHMLKSYRYTYTDIAEALGRTESAIYIRIQRLCTPYRPISDGSSRWTPREVEKLLELSAQGYSWDDIGKKIGRSAKSAVNKYGKYIREANNERVKKG